ncbi:hypothetical protein KAU11_10650 [Candidatus Babeliales bacterium]|nr:hypothetical protein [Candidatus Babeliales bacterium]
MTLKEKIESDNNRIPRYGYFKALELLKDRKIKLVIVGQEPYSTGAEEFGKYVLYNDGLAFSSSNTIKTPHTLKTLQEWFKLADSDRGYKVGKVRNDLSYLIDRGVFLMNVLWTTSFMKPKTHNFPEYYELTGRILRKIIEKNPEVKIALLGRVASTMSRFVEGVEYISDIHPAAARYDNNTYEGGLTKLLKGSNLRLTL